MTSPLQNQQSSLKENTYARIQTNANMKQTTTTTTTTHVQNTHIKQKRRVRDVMQYACLLAPFFLLSTAGPQETEAAAASHSYLSKILYRAYSNTYTRHAPNNMARFQHKHTPCTPHCNTACATVYTSMASSDNILCICQYLFKYPHLTGKQGHSLLERSAN